MHKNRIRYLALGYSGSTLAPFHRPTIHIPVPTAGCGSVTVLAVSPVGRGGRERSGTTNNGSGVARNATAGRWHLGAVIRSKTVLGQDPGLPPRRCPCGIMIRLSWEE